MQRTLEAESVQPVGTEGSGEVLGERPRKVMCCSLFLQEAVVSYIVSISPASGVVAATPRAIHQLSIVLPVPGFGGNSLSG